MGIKHLIHDSCIYLDTNIFIYALEAYPEYLSVLTSIFTSVDKGEYFAITSELTLAEVLIKPKMDKNRELEQAYMDVLQSSNTLSVIPINREILIEAASIRSISDTIHLPDAIHLATARIHKCSSFITNDKRLKSAPGIPVVILSDHLG